MKTVGYVIPDVHEKIKKLKWILNTFIADEYTFLCDFFDSWDGVTSATTETAVWLKEALYNPKYDFTIANHDLHYRLPTNDLCCSGWDARRSRIIDDIIHPHDWERFSLFKYLNNNTIVSHAGLHETFLHPLYGFDKAWMEMAEERSLSQLRMGQSSPLIRPGEYLGGRQPIGGCTWLNWDNEFQPIPGLNQIVGHTQHVMVQYKITPDSWNINLDTNLNHILKYVRDEETGNIEYSVIDISVCPNEIH